MKQVCVLFLFVLVVVFNTRAQSTSDYVIDSLILIVETAQDDTNKVKTLNTIGSKLLSVNDLSRAMLYTQETIFLIEKLEAITIAGTISWRALKAEKGLAYYTIGLIYRKQGNYPEALLSCSSALLAYQAIDNKSGIASSYYNLGTNYFLQSNYSKSLENYLIALGIYMEINNKTGISFAYNSIGIIHYNQGNYPEAFKYYMSSLQIKEELGDKKGISNTYTNLGHIYANLGNSEEALKNHLACLKIKEELGDKYAVTVAYNNIGIAYKNMGNYKEALTYFFESVRIKEELNDRAGIALCYYNIGNIYNEQSNYTESMKYYTSSLTTREELGEQIGIAACLNVMARVKLRQGGTQNLKESIAYATRSYKLTCEIGAPIYLKATCRTLVLDYLKSSQIDSAFFYLSVHRSTIAKELQTNYFSLSERERELYFVTLELDFGLYYECASTLLHDYPALTDTAYNIALKNKGLSLKSSTAMRQAILKSNDPVLISDYESWLELKKKIAKLYDAGKDITELEQHAGELEKNLVKKSVAFSDFDKVISLDWKQVRSGLKPNECAIEFINFQSEIDTAFPIIYAALIVKPESEHPEMIRLCPESELIEILGTIQGNNLDFVNSIYGTRKEAKTALYEKIWQPLDSSLQSIKTIYFSPSGLLHKISFASISKSQNVFLSDIYNFRQMGSTGKVALDEDVAFGELENFLLMGGVNYNSQNSSKEVWSYLPGSLQETESINSFLIKKKFGVNYFHSNNASEEIFKEKIVSSSIVHIATHGFFFPDPEKVKEEMKADSESNQELKFRGTTNYANWSFVNNKNPLMRSGIVLANANDVWERDALAEGEDGILTAQEVSNLDLRNTKLVVLSACETGLGDIHGSEGVFGLQRVFKMAGVKYLIMSLWQVPDKETSEFMILFYNSLIKLKDIPKAFQKAQKAMRKRYDPYFWGAFVLIE